MQIDAQGRHLVSGKFSDVEVSTYKIGESPCTCQYRTGHSSCGIAFQHLDFRLAAIIIFLTRKAFSFRNRVLVFVLYKKEAAQMESYLQRKGWTAVAIHGDKGQADRSRALQQFRDGTIPLLVSNAATLCLLGVTWIWARLVSRTGPPLIWKKKGDSNLWFSIESLLELPGKT